MKTLSLITITVFIATAVITTPAGAAPIVDFQLMIGGETYDSANPLEIDIGEQLELEVWGRVTENEGLGLGLYEIDINISGDRFSAVEDPGTAGQWLADFDVDWSVRKQGDLSADQSHIQEHRAGILWNVDTVDPEIAANEWEKLSFGMLQAASYGLEEINISHIWNITAFEDENGSYGTYDVMATEGSVINEGDSLALFAVPEPSTALLLLAGLMTLLGRRRHRG